MPIEVENKEALDSLVGAFGMVDLYAPEKEGPSWRQIGSRMKLARSETGFMSLLVPEQDALKLLAEEGPFLWAWPWSPPWLFGS